MAKIFLILKTTLSRVVFNLSLALKFQALKLLFKHSLSRSSVPVFVLRHRKLIPFSLFIKAWLLAFVINFLLLYHSLLFVTSIIGVVPAKCYSLSMNKKHFTKFKVKDKVLKSELVRAHGMIILLVVALMAVLTVSSSFDVALDPILTFWAVILLAVVGLLSLSVVIAIVTKRK